MPPSSWPPSSLLMCRNVHRCYDPPPVSVHVQICTHVLYGGMEHTSCTCAYQCLKDSTMCNWTLIIAVFAGVWTEECKGRSRTEIDVENWPVNVAIKTPDVPGAIFRLILSQRRVPVANLTFSHSSSVSLFMSRFPFSVNSRIFF